MRLRAALARTQHAAGTTSDTHLVVSLHGETGSHTRPRVAVLPVVDRSGSMATDGKLTTVTAALAHLAALLGAQDRVALVSFDDHVSTDVPTRAADPAGLRALTDALTRLTPRGSTNLHAALVAAVAAANRTSSDTLTRVIVLTDGRANSGPVDTATLAAALAERSGHVSVSFLGVGADCDHAQLGALAEAGGGSYGFIETAADAPDVLGTEVGGLLDAEATQIEVSVTPRRKHAQLTGAGVLGRPGTVDPDPDGAAVTVTLPSLLRGVTRDLVIPVTLSGPKRPHARPVTVADIRIRASVDGQQVEHTLLPKAHFAATAGDDDAELVGIVELAQVADALRTAREQADAGDLAGARHLVTGLDLRTGAAATLLAAAAPAYNSAVDYAAAAPQLSSTIAAVGGTLSGSSTSFDALAARTLGGYRSAGQVATAAATTAAVAQSGTTTPPPIGLAGPLLGAPPAAGAQPSPGEPDVAGAAGTADDEVDA